jgi:hypothetical protein
MGMRSLVLMSGAVSILTVVSAARLPAQDAPVPIVQEPRHRVVFESDIARVHDVQVPPGDTTLYHIHDTPILYVPISRSLTRTQPLGGEWSGGDPSQPVAAEAGPGRVTSTTSYVDKPLTHRVNNVGDGLFRLIAIVNRTSGTTTENDDVSGLTGKPEVANRYYRAYRVDLPAGQATTSHAHAVPIVIVQQTSGRAMVEGSTKAELREPGAFALHTGPGAHRVKNAGTGAVTVIEIELRGAASGRAPL